MKKFSIFLLLYLLASNWLSAQSAGGTIRGVVVDASSNEPVPFASVVIWNTTIGAMTDYDGNFLFTGITPGFVEVRVSSVGYKPYVSEPVMVTNNNEAFINVSLESSVVAITDVVVRASPFRKKIESPLSARIISIEEIEMNPGGNRDISKVIQSFPGVASTPAFRNDIIVRGGGPNENRFFLDNVEIPYLNHFSTQGASGGPVGIINIDFVRSVDFISGAFPANRGNVLSSVMNFSLVDGNREKRTLRATVGASDLGLTFNGPSGPNGSLIFSARRSYLQFLFSALDLPFLPTYTDFQFKYKVALGKNNDLTFLGLGAKDDFRLNLKADETEYQRYILGYIPVQEQYTYTVGSVFRHLRSNGSDMVVLSRNYLNNTQYKYLDNIEEEANKILDYNSGEGDIRLRYEGVLSDEKALRISYGAGTVMSRYRNDTFRKVFSGASVDTTEYSTSLLFFRYSFFSQVSKVLMNERLRLSFGISTEANSYSSVMANPLRQLSPRIAASYAISGVVSFNFSTGRYSQLPPYTSLGYKSSEGDYANKNNKISYIYSDQVSAGFEIIPEENIQLTAEGFYKHYANYPFSVNDSVPLSTRSAGYGIFGDEEVVSSSSGRAFGLEVMARMQDVKGINMVFAYTLVRSEFRGNNENYIPTAWDNRHLISLTATKDFRKGWDAGIKWRFVGGAPYTPYDLDRSSLKEAWDISGQGYPDYSRYNSERLRAFNQLDVRVDKRFFFKKWSLMLYLDVQNVLNYKADQPDLLVLQTDANNLPLTDPSDAGRYLLKTIEAQTGTVLPTIGVIIEI